MDRHHKVGFTWEEICVAHEKDLEIQGVRPSRVSTNPSPVYRIVPNNAGNA